MEKITVHKWMEYDSKFNFVGGQIAHDGTLLLIESSLEELDFFNRPVPKNDWTIRIINGETIETVILPHVPLMPTEVDLFSDGTLLLVQGRCLKDGTTIERNARRYNRNGQLISAFTLGDGINQVQIDETDTIWVSYFDEGVFGNFGWDEPMGSDGLIAYSMDGQKLWGAQNYDICDCYAMNVVSSKEIYFYYYDDFWFVQLSDMKEVQRNRVEGNPMMHQFLVDEEGIIGQLDLSTIIRYRLKGKTFASKNKIQFVDETGKRVLGHVFMRGKYLYVCGKDGIYRK
ncbi:hypothetical protein [Ureibacillus galli]|nr:hypothetical protein [Ureibacillus galli]